MTIVVTITFLAILGSLGVALYFMVKGSADGKPRSGGMARALAIRVGLSILLLVCILLAWKLGYIQPTGIPPGR